MTTLNLTDLEAKARAATPGPWEWWTSNSFRRLSGPDGRDGGVLSAVVHRDGQPDVLCSEADRAHIAAASPDVVLELVARVRELEGVLLRVHEHVSPGCGEFGLTSEQEQVIAEVAHLVRGGAR